MFSAMLFNDDMKTNDEIRRLNMLLLSARAGNAAKLAALVRTAPAYLSQIKGRAKDSKSGTPKAMGDEVARRMEVSMSLPSGWMDAPHYADWVSAGLANEVIEEVELLLHEAVAAQPLASKPPMTEGDDLGDALEIIGRPRLIPIVGRVEAGEDGLLHIDDYGVDSPDGYLLWFTTCREAYGLRIRGESMSPRYFPGEYVGVDPCAEVLPSDEVIVLRADGRRMIKRLLWQRDDQACFESVNKAFQNVILDNSEISGMHLVLGRVPKSAFRQNAD